MYLRTQIAEHLQLSSSIWAKGVRGIIEGMSYFGRAYLNQVFDTQSADMWAWCSHSCLNKCRRRNPRRDHLLLLDSSKANIWASRFLICGPGALQPYLIKCSKRNQRRARLVVKAWVQASLWVFTGLIWAWGSQLCLSKCSKRNHRRMN